MTLPSPDNGGDWPRLVRDLVEALGRHEHQTDRLADLCDRVAGILERDVSARELAATLERQRIELHARQLDREAEAHARAELEAAAREDRRRDWWERVCDRGRAALGSPHADRALSGTVGAVLVVLAWLVSRITGATPPSLGGP